MTISKIGKHNENFMYLTDENIKKLNELSILRSHKKGQFVFYEGDLRTNIYFLVEGILKLEKTDVDDRYNYIDFKKPKSIVPQTGMFTDEKYFYSGIAHTDIKAFSIPVNIYEEILMQSREQLIVTIEKQSEIIKNQMIKIQNSTVNDTEIRVESTIALLYKTVGDVQYPYQTVRIPFPLTINDIARSSGASRETTSIIIKKLSNEKRVNYNKKCLIIIDTQYFNNILKNLKREGVV